MVIRRMFFANYVNEGDMQKFSSTNDSQYMLSSMDQVLLWSNGRVSLARRWGWCDFAASDDINIPVQDRVWPSETSYRHPII